MMKCLSIFIQPASRLWRAQRLLIGCTWFLMLLFCFEIGLWAAPSGGPYGPIRQVFPIPRGARTIYYVAPDGKPENPGTSLDRPTTIEAAIVKAVTGDVILLRGGIYRTGNLVFNQGITLQPFRDEQPVFKGTWVATEWRSLGNGLWVTRWERLFPSAPADWWRREREGKFTPLHRFHNDMVFIDGRFLQSVGWEGEVDANTFYIDYGSGLVYIGMDPTGHEVEITAYDVALLRTTSECHGRPSDGKGPVIRGITFTQYAYRAIEVEGKDPEGLSPESDHGKDVIGTRIEHCTISYCSRVAAYLRGDRLVLRHCRVSDTSTEGIYILSSSDVLLERNLFMRNNIERITGYYPAAVKIFNQCYRVTCNDNLVIDHPFSNGIWYDVGNVDGVFVDNWVEGVGQIREEEMPKDRLWPSDNGFFFEISKGVLCAGNVFVDCDHGVMILNSSNARIVQNTFVNSTACIGRTARTAAGDHFGWHPSTGPDVHEREGHVFVNNLLVGTAGFTRPLLFVWQPASLCERLDKPQLQRLDHNVYVRTTSTAEPLILWGPAPEPGCQAGFPDPASLHARYPQFSAGDRYYPQYDGPLFQSPELGHFRLLPTFPGLNAATPLPVDIRRLIGLKGSDRFVGAYPPMP